MQQDLVERLNVCATLHKLEALDVTSNFREKIRWQFHRIRCEERRHLKHSLESQTKLKHVFHLRFLHTVDYSKIPVLSRAPDNSVNPVLQVGIIEDEPYIVHRGRTVCSVRPSTTRCRDF